MKKNPNYTLVVLRYGLAFVFIWFACSQFGNPTKWVSFLPSWVGSLPIAASSFVQINALFEIVAAALLILGAWTRISALFLGLHLLGIALSIGYDATAIRDLGLAVACLALAMGGAGMFSIDTAAEKNQIVGLS